MNYRTTVGIFCLLFYYLFWTIACTTSADKSEEESVVGEVQKDTIAHKIANIIEAPEMVDLDSTTHHRYSWLEDYDFQNALVNQILPPEGYTRVLQDSHSFANWLRHIPLKPENENVLLFNGQLKGNQEVHHRVVDIDTGTRDLQQCADAVMRLKAEYHYSIEDFEQIHFNYTSGPTVAFADWIVGKKPIIQGNKVTFSTPTENLDKSYRNFQKYMIQVFSYAGTASLTKELVKISKSKIQAGDVFIQGGFPGHAVMVIDVAQNKSGKKVFLLAQSYMPAQDLHILRNWEDAKLSPWYSLSFGQTLSTPEWSFTKNDLKRFQDKVEH